VIDSPDSMKVAVSTLRQAGGAQAVIEGMLAPATPPLAGVNPGPHP
jgi:hypothetical protein